MYAKKKSCVLIQCLQLLLGCAIYICIFLVPMVRNPVDASYDPSAENTVSKMPHDRKLPVLCHNSELDFFF